MTDDGEPVILFRAPVTTGWAAAADMARASWGRHAPVEESRGRSRGGRGRDQPER